MESLTQEYVRSILDYNPETGVFTWKKRFDVAWWWWNDRYAGKKAGRLKKDGRWEVIINKKYYIASRIAWLYMKGKFPKNQIDHKDLNKGNDSFLNLREATPTQNQCNQRKPKCNTSGFKGVTRNDSGRWVARIRINKYHKHIGVYSSPQEAHVAYCDAAKKYHGEFARFE